MKLPVKLDVLMSEWANDSVINELDIQNELLKIPKLHAKYLNVLTHHNLIASKLMHQYSERKRLMWEYYCGDLNNPEDLQKYGFEPLDKKILKPNISMYIESDTNLNNILLKKILHEEIVDACKFIIKELQSRTWQLKTYSDNVKFLQGQ
jgi:hypothetical protein